MHDGGLDLGRWPEGAGRYAERQSDVAIELGEHAEAAVRLAAGRRGQALGHLALEHECHLADGPARAHERHQDRLRHAIGQITQDDHPAAGRGHERPVVPRAGIGVDDLDGLEAPTQLGREPAIDLERDDAAGAPRELARQRTLPRTDLEHEVVSRRRDEIDDAASDGGVAQKMLAESAAPVVHVSHGTTPRRAGIGVAKLLIGEGLPCSKRSWSAPISRRPRTKRGGSPSSWRGASAPSSRSDRKSTRLNSSHGYISYAVFCFKKKKHTTSRYLQLIQVRRFLTLVVLDGNDLAIRVGYPGEYVLLSGIRL